MPTLGQDLAGSFFWVPRGAVFPLTAGQEPGPCECQGPGLAPFFFTLACSAFQGWYYVLYMCWVWGNFSP